MTNDINPATLPAEDAMASLEARIAARPAPKVTPADIEAEIASEHYFTAAEGVAGEASLRHRMVVTGDKHPPEALKLLTFCVITMRNGFTVTGESACASPENFDAQIGREVARKAAVLKVWPLMGFRLRDNLHNLAQFDRQQDA